MEIHASSMHKELETIGHLLGAPERPSFAPTVAFGLCAIAKMTMQVAFVV
jgi:hypothetical protein